MTGNTPTPPFPCPFCHSNHVQLVGGGLVFLHYRCSECAEVWTAMAATRPALLRPSGAPKVHAQQEGRKTREKLWRH
jgi:hypothetical protein